MRDTLAANALPRAGRDRRRPGGRAAGREEMTGRRPGGSRGRSTACATSRAACRRRCACGPPPRCWPARRPRAHARRASSVDEGTQMLMLNVFNHRDPDHVADADGCVPERWGYGERDYRFNHLSNGSQDCPGGPLVLLLGKAVLAQMLARCELTLERAAAPAPAGRCRTCSTSSTCASRRVARVSVATRRRRRLASVGGGRLAELRPGAGDGVTEGRTRGDRGREPGHRQAARGPAVHGRGRRAGGPAGPGRAGRWARTDFAEREGSCCASTTWCWSARTRCSTCSSSSPARPAGTPSRRSSTWPWSPATTRGRPSGCCDAKRRRGALPFLTATWEYHHPVGVVGVISPWNYPLTLSISDAVPALAAGNAVVMKADRKTPFSGAVGARAAGGGGSARGCAAGGHRVGRRTRARADRAGRLHHVHRQHGGGAAGGQPGRRAAHPELDGAGRQERDDRARGCHAGAGGRGRRAGDVLQRRASCASRSSACSCTRASPTSSWTGWSSGCAGCAWAPGSATTSTWVTDLRGAARHGA